MKARPVNKNRQILCRIPPACYARRRPSHVSGIASGSGYASKGRYQGIAPQSQIISLKILDENGQGNSAQALAGIQWLLDHQKKYNIRIANLSIGSNDRTVNLPLVRALNTAWDHGIVIVAASGNRIGKEENAYPPPLSKKIITVGIYEEGAPPPPSSDVLAPGTEIVSCLSPQYAFRSRNRKMQDIVGRDYIKMSGSSMATPMVSGAIALLLAKHPTLAPDEIKACLHHLGENAGAANFRPGLLSVPALMAYASSLCKGRTVSAASGSASLPDTSIFSKHQ